MPKYIFDGSGEISEISHSAGAELSKPNAQESTTKRRDKQARRENLKKRKIEGERKFLEQKVKVGEETHQVQMDGNGEGDKEDPSANVDTDKEKQPISDKGALKAKEYLNLFLNDRKSWKFKKLQQTWILQNLFYQHQMDNQTFKDSLIYLKGLSPAAREETLRVANEFLENDCDTIKKRAKKLIKTI